LLPFFLYMREKLIKYLEKFVTEKRNETFDQVIKSRTKYITVVLEDLFQAHNASAVLRTCDCFGIQDVHIIENRNRFLANSEISLGSEKWLSIRKYNGSKHNSAETVTILKEKGYRIVATTPHNDDIPLDELDLYRGKAALFFGTELGGLSKEVLQQADEYLKIPMYGFTESFNISVTAAIVLHTLTEKLRKSKIDWALTDQEKQEIKLAWLKTSIKNSDLIEKQFLNKSKSSFGI
jgi:tRNA (guanosine-2'-O-)-methyltransferase